jgi:hypothetical protein
MWSTPGCIIHVQAPMHSLGACNTVCKSRSSPASSSSLHAINNYPTCLQEPSQDVQQWDYDAKQHLLHNKWLHLHALHFTCQWSARHYATRLDDCDWATGIQCPSYRNEWHMKVACQHMATTPPFISAPFIRGRFAAHHITSTYNIHKCLCTMPVPR